MDNAAAFKGNGCWFESLLAGYLDKGNVHCREARMSMQGGSYNVKKCTLEHNF